MGITTPDVSATAKKPNEVNIYLFVSYVSFHTKAVKYIYKAILA